MTQEGTIQVSRVLQEIENQHENIIRGLELIKYRAIQLSIDSPNTKKSLVSEVASKVNAHFQFEERAMLAVIMDASRVGVTQSKSADYEDLLRHIRIHARQHESVMKTIQAYGSRFFMGNLPYGTLYGAIKASLIKHDLDCDRRMIELFASLNQLH